MTFSIQMILDGLGDPVHEDLGSQGESNPIVTATRFQNNLTRFENDILYVGRVSELPEDRLPEEVFYWLCIHDRPIPSRYRSMERGRLISIDCQNAPEELLARIKEWMSARRKIIQAQTLLYEALLSGKGLSHILAVAADLMGNPIMISDRSFKTIGSSPEVETTDYFWQIITKLGFAPAELVNSPFFRQHIQRVYHSDTPDIGASSYSTNTVLSCRIALGERVIGHVAVLDCLHPFHTIDHELIQLLCKVVSIEIQKEDFYHHAKGRMFEFFIAELLDRKELNPTMLAERIKYLELDLNNNLYVLVVRSEDPEKENPSLLYARSVIESLLDENHSVIYDEDIVVLIDRNVKIAQLIEDLKELLPVLRDNQLVAGLSQRFEQIADIRKFYQQSCKAIRFGIQLGGEPGERLFAYDRYLVYDLIDLAALQNDPRSLINPLVYDLMDFDKKNNTALAHSLSEYLNCHNNPKRTAFLLGIHRNTLDYRIKKIEELLNIQLNDPKLNWSLFLSFKILEML